MPGFLNFRRTVGVDENAIDFPVLADVVIDALRKPVESIDPEKMRRGIELRKKAVENLHKYSFEVARDDIKLAAVFRFNMRYLRGISDAREHNWLALVPENFIHQRLISDLAGYDPGSHIQTPAAVIKSVAAWLSLQPEFSPAAPTARKILQAHPRFSELLTKAKEDELGSLTQQTVLEQASVVVAEMG